jgi:hypothetical protein
MIPDLNYCPADEENYTAEQPSDSKFLTEIFSSHNQTNSYQTYNQTNSYQTYDQTNSYSTYDQTKIYQTYDQINSYMYSVIYSNNIICQQPNPAVPLYNFFGGSSSTTSGCNLVDNIGRTEEKIILMVEVALIQR